MYDVPVPNTVIISAFNAATPSSFFTWETSGMGRAWQTGSEELAPEFMISQLNSISHD